MGETLSNIVRSNDRVAPAAALHVEVIADLICPFCYLGKRRLDRAMRAVRGPSDVSWYPYQLNPDMPLEGMSTDKYLSLRFGDPSNVQPVLDDLAAEGRRDGIEFRFDKLTHVPNTLPAHQVMYLAEMDGRDQSALAEDLMHAFFERGENIGDREVLIESSRKHGMAADRTAAIIDDDKARQLVLSREAQVRSGGMVGVPGYLLNRRLLIVGAQSTDTMINAFDRAMFGESDDALANPITVH